MTHDISRWGILFYGKQKKSTSDPEKLLQMFNLVISREVTAQSIFLCLAMFNGDLSGKPTDCPRILCYYIHLIYKAVVCSVVGRMANSIRRLNEF